VTARNGDGLDDATDANEAGRVDEFGDINDPAVAENLPPPQAADMTVRPVEPVVIMHRRFYFNRRSYEWRQVGQNWELATASRVVAQVVADALHPGMYRVDLGDDPLSDMVNLTRAKDAALSLADRAIEKGRQRVQGAPPISFPDPAAQVLPGGRRR